MKRYLNNIIIIIKTVATYAVLRLGWSATVLRRSATPLSKCQKKNNKMDLYFSKCYTSIVHILRLIENIFSL